MIQPNEDENKSMEQLIADFVDQYKDWDMLLMVCSFGCKDQPPWVCLAKPLEDGSYEYEGDEDLCDVCGRVGKILNATKRVEKEC